MIRRNQQGVYVPRRSSSTLASLLSGNNNDLTPGEQISKMAMDSNNFGSGYAGGWGALAQGLTAGIGAWTQKKERDQNQLANEDFERTLTGINPSLSGLSSHLTPETREAISANMIADQYERQYSTATPQSPYGKLNVDLQNGFIDPKSYNAIMRKETMFAGDRATPDPSAEKTPKPLSQEAAKTYTLAKGGIDVVNNMRRRYSTFDKTTNKEVFNNNKFQKDAAVSSLPNFLQGEDSQLLQTDIKDISDRLGRMRSGGAITSDEQYNTFLKLVPRFGDSSQTAKYKLERLEKEFNNVADSIRPQQPQPQQTQRPNVFKASNGVPFTIKR